MFSPTDRESKIAPPWKTIPIFSLPLPPMTVTVSAGRIARSIPDRTGVPLNDLETWRNSMIVPLTLPALPPPEELRQKEIRDDDRDGRGDDGRGGRLAQPL